MDSGIEDELVRALAEDIASASFQSKFEQFFLDHALRFDDEQEHQLAYTEIYREFQDMFDQHMKGKQSVLSVQHRIRKGW